MPKPVHPGDPTAQPALGVLTIHHDYDSGTTVQGTTKHSLAHNALKDHRSWTWSRDAGAWLLRSSRHRKPKAAAIIEMRKILEELGYTVEDDIDPATPDMKQQEQDLADRIDDRAQRPGPPADP